MKILTRCFAFFLASVILIWLFHDKSEPCTTPANIKSTKLAVIMYHGFTPDKETSQYVINTEDFKSDLEYLTGNGFSFVDTGEVINYITKGIPLPDKPVMLTFDDGYLNNYTLAFPLLKKYNAKAVISPIMYYCEQEKNTKIRNEKFNNLSFDEIRYLAKSGIIEFANHSYNLHTFSDSRKGSGKELYENEDMYRERFFSDTLKAHNMLKKLTGTSPEVYTYPFGHISTESKNVLWCMGYKLALGCRETFCNITPFQKKLYILNRFNRTPSKSVKLLLKNY